MAPIAPAPRTTMSLMARAVWRKVARGDDLEFVRQEPLLDEQDRVAPEVKRDCAKMAGAAVDGDVQTILIFIFRILLSMLR